MLELTDSLKSLLIETVNNLKGHQKRRFMAQTVKELGLGGQRLAQRELGWNRDLIRKGTREVETGIVCLDAFQARGRKRVETRLPNLLEDLTSLLNLLLFSAYYLPFSLSRTQVNYCISQELIILSTVL